MTETTETKWQYVARAFRGRGDTPTAEVADKIDALLSTITEYDSVTDEWVADLDSGEVDSMNLIDVVQCSCYCTACEYHGGFSGCEVCEFAARGGRELFFALKHVEDGE